MVRHDETFAYRWHTKRAHSHQSREIEKDTIKSVKAEQKHGKKCLQNKAHA